MKRKNHIWDIELRVEVGAITEQTADPAMETRTSRKKLSDLHSL